MSNAQIKAVVTVALNIATVTIVFASKAFIYLLIALYIAGEMMFADYAQSVPSPQPIAPDTDLDDDIAEAIDDWASIADTDMAEAVTPSPVTLAKSIARSTAVRSIPTAVQLSIPTPPIAQSNHYATLTAVQLRKECSAQNVKWRNAHGTSKHLSKAEMLTALAA